MTTIYHPKTKELSGTITEVENEVHPEDRFEAKVLGFEDWYPTREEAEAWIQQELQYEYSGQAAKDSAADAHYARQEQVACGNW